MLREIADLGLELKNTFPRLCVGLAARMRQTLYLTPELFGEKLHEVRCQQLRLKGGQDRVL